MKASELVSELKKAIEEHGDLDCYGFCGGNGVGRVIGVVRLKKVWLCSKEKQYDTRVLFIDTTPEKIPEVDPEGGNAL